MKTKTIYLTVRIDFEYDDDTHPGCLERYKQDET
jgi:hypothetical protein